MNLIYTVWKLHNFSITQILREINLGVTRSAKFTILPHLEAVNFDFHEFCTFWLLVNYKKGTAYQHLHQAWICKSTVQYRAIDTYT